MKLKEIQNNYKNRNIDFLKMSLKSAINNRTEVLDNFDKYKIKDVYRVKLIDNLKYFKDKYNSLYS